MDAIKKHYVRRRKRLLERYYRADSFNEKSRTALALSRMDDDDYIEEPEAWITTENHHKVPLDENGIAMAGGGGTLEGMDFSDAEATPVDSGSSGSQSSGGASSSTNTPKKDAKPSNDRSVEKTNEFKEKLDSIKPYQQCKFLERSGILPATEAEGLINGVRNGDQASLDRMEELKLEYFERAEQSHEPKGLTDYDSRYWVEGMADEDAQAFVKQSISRKLEDWEGWANPYSDAQKVAIDLGLCDTPQVLCKEDFDAYVQESGAAVIYRGLKDTDNISSENMQYQMLYNGDEPYFGNGIFGDGLYFSTLQSTGQAYCSDNKKPLTCALRPDAKVLEYGSDEMKAAMKRLNTTDESIAAICSGYDAIVKSKKSVYREEQYYIILNRAALVAQDNAEDTVDRIMQMK